MTWERPKERDGFKAAVIAFLITQTIILLFGLGLLIRYTNVFVR